MKKFNHPFITGIILCLFVWFAIFCYTKEQLTFPVPKAQQSGDTKSERDKADKFISFQLESYDVNSLFGRRGVK